MYYVNYDIPFAFVGDKYGMDYKCNRSPQLMIKEKDIPIFFDGGGMISTKEPKTEIIDVDGTKFQTFVAHAPYFLDHLKSLTLRQHPDNLDWPHYSFYFDTMIGRVCIISPETYKGLVEKLEVIVNNTKEQAELLEFEKAEAMEEAGGVSKRLCVCQSKKNYRDCCGMRKELNG